MSLLKPSPATPKSSGDSKCSVCAQLRSLMSRALHRPLNFVARLPLNRRNS